jgi:hypothetical protein
MATIITTKTYWESVQEVTPSKVFADTAQTVQAGANVVCTLPRAGACLIIGEIAFTAVDTQMDQLQPCFDSDVGLATAPYYGRNISGLWVPINNGIIMFKAINYAAASAYFGLWNAGTLTTTYTFDYSFRWYPLN